MVPTMATVQVSGSLAECCAGRKEEQPGATGKPISKGSSGVRLQPSPTAKITDLVGTWKVEAEEGSLDEYLSLIGVPWVFRKMVVRPIGKQPLQTWRMESGVLVTGYEERGDEPDKWPLANDEVWRNPITTQLTKRSIVFKDGVLSQTSHGWVDGHVAETRFFVVGDHMVEQCYIDGRLMYGKRSYRVSL